MPNTNPTLGTCINITWHNDSCAVGCIPRFFPPSVLITSLNFIRKISSLSFQMIIENKGVITCLFMNLMLVIQKEKEKVTFSSFVTEWFLPLPLDRHLSNLSQKKSRDSAPISESDSLLNLPFSQSQI